MIVLNDYLFNSVYLIIGTTVYYLQPYKFLLNYRRIKILIHIFVSLKKQLFRKDNQRDVLEVYIPAQVHSKFCIH